MSEQRINTTNGAETVLQTTALEQLQGRLRGELLCPGDDRYESARKIHNGMIDWRPALIVRCAEGGCTWGDFDHETQASGLATVGGIARPTGIAGTTARCWLQPTKGIS
jgi:hypothetical protein